MRHLLPFRLESCLDLHRLCAESVWWFLIVVPPGYAKAALLYSTTLFSLRVFTALAYSKWIVVAVKVHQMQEMEVSSTREISYWSFAAASAHSATLHPVTRAARPE